MFCVGLNGMESNSNKTSYIKKLALILQIGNPKIHQRQVVNAKMQKAKIC